MKSGAKPTGSAAELRAEVERLKVENSLLRGKVSELRKDASKMGWLIADQQNRIAELRQSLSQSEEEIEQAVHFRRQ